MICSSNHVGDVDAFSKILGDVASNQSFRLTHLDLSVSSGSLPRLGAVEDVDAFSAKKLTCYPVVSADDQSHDDI